MPVAIEARSHSGSIAVVFEDDGENGNLYAVAVSGGDQRILDRNYGRPVVFGGNSGVKRPAFETERRPIQSIRAALAQAQNRGRTERAARLRRRIDSSRIEADCRRLRQSFMAAGETRPNNLLERTVNDVASVWPRTAAGQPKRQATFAPHGPDAYPPRVWTRRRRVPLAHKAAGDWPIPVIWIAFVSTG